MLMFKRLKLNSAKSRLVEERLYEMVMDELESGNVRKGIWGKAVAKSNGNDNQAKSKYLELRVESLKDEAHVIKSILDTDVVKSEPKPDLIEAEERKPDLIGSLKDLLWVVTVFSFLIIVTVAYNNL